ncbi:MULTISPECIES: DUF6364 family protein [unclassified Endozoicomonas]|uniref:DUF6364 family protein n=1 Tax=unclassified Endozoicomonas TaxID=2644528 RepID=UPI003BB5C7A3
MSKLTLTVTPEVIRQAKIYGASQQQSLSRLVENFLKTLPEEPDTGKVRPEKQLTGRNAELAGIISEKELIFNYYLKL